jgi:hypothetical protein
MVTTKTITSANAVFLLNIPGVYNQVVQIQGFSTDTAFTEDSIAPAEAVMGVDGFLSAGLVLHPTKQKISLAADSASVTIFDQWYEAQRAVRDVFFANGTIELTSLGKTYNLTKGVLTGYKHVPDAKKMLGNQEYEITWETISTAQV